MGRLGHYMLPPAGRVEPLGPPQHAGGAGPGRPRRCRGEPRRPRGMPGPSRWLTVSMSSSATTTSVATSPPGTREGARVPVLVGLLFGLTGLGSSSAAIVLPVIGADLDVSIGVGAWAISLYALMLAVATAVYGRISDLVGLRLPLVVGVCLMTLGALAGALAPNFGVLLGARIVQGAGAAAVPTLGVAIVAARFSGSARGVALGRVAGLAAAVACLGPLAGGVIEGCSAGGRSSRCRCSARDAAAAVALGAQPGKWCPPRPVRRGPGGGDRCRGGAARAVALDGTGGGGGRGRARRARRTRRGRVGPPPTARFPAGRRDPQRRRGPERTGGGRRPGRLVRTTDRRARRTGRTRLGALAGGRGAGPECGDRLACPSPREPAAEPDRSDVGPRPGRGGRRRGARCLRPGRAPGVRDPPGRGRGRRDVRVRAGPACADGSRRGRRRRRRARRRARHRHPVLPGRRRSRFSRRGRSRRRARHGAGPASPHRPAAGRTGGTPSPAARYARRRARVADSPSTD